MSPSMDQPRPDSAARHRAEPAAPPTKSHSVLRKAADLRVMSQRMAVVAGAVAVLLAVGTAGQAAEQALTTQEQSAAVTSDASAQGGSSKDGATQAESKATPEPSLPPETKAKPSETPPPAAPPAAPAAPAAPAPAAPAPVVPAAPVAVNDPAGAKAYAASQLAAYGWDQSQMQSLLILWEKESNWSTTAVNASSGAYGIVQSLPASKMASIAADWETNYRTQIAWGLNYIKERYGSPAGALNFHYANNWY